MITAILELPLFASIGVFSRAQTFLRLHKELSEWGLAAETPMMDDEYWNGLILPGTASCRAAVVNILLSTNLTPHVLPTSSVNCEDEPSSEP